jgi:PPOX class probable F420-dependent enzyme
VAVGATNALSQDELMNLSLFLMSSARGLIATDIDSRRRALPTSGQNADSWVAKLRQAVQYRLGAIDSHRAADRHVLSDHERRFLLTRRVGHLATADRRAIPHVVPVCFAISQGTLYITIDEKPKRTAESALKRVRNIERNPMVAIVVDRYDEDWTRLGWVMLRGQAEILREGTEHDRAQELLRSRYRQLAAMRIAELPVIAVRLERVTSWGNLSVGADEADNDDQA